MNLKNMTKMCASVLLALMIVGMPLYLVTSSVFGSKGNYDLRPPILEPELTTEIGLSPICTMLYPTTVQMTGNTIFNLEGMINLDDYFSNPDDDVRLAYYIDYPSDVVDVVLEGSRITSITTLGVYGDFMLTAIASNYYGSAEYNFIMLVDPKETLVTYEDEAIWHDMGVYIPSSTDCYEVETTQGISTEVEMSYGEPTLMSIIPDPDWFGEGRIHLQIYDSPYCIPTPPLSQEQVCMEDDLSSWFYGCFEFDVAVNGVNDPPTSEGAAPIRLTMTSDSSYSLVEPIRLDKLFTDVDSEMTYSWSSLNGCASIDIRGNEIVGFSTKENVGSDILRLVANDGEYVGTYEFPVCIIPKQILDMEEDVSSYLQLDEYVDVQTQEYSMNQIGYIQAEISFDEDDAPFATLTPGPDWNGADAVGLSVYPVTTSINPPFDSDSINCLPPGPSIPPMPYVEYAYYEFILNVAPVNDLPYSIPGAWITMMEDMPLSNAFNVGDCFGDVDSDLDFVLGMTPASRLDVDIDNDGFVNIMPEENWFGSQLVWLIATDGEYTVSLDVPVTVQPVNDIPFASELPETVTVDEDNMISINLANYIADVEDALWYSFLSNDTNTTMVLDEKAWNLNITPDENWNGIVQITIFGADDEYQVARNLTLEILSVNDVPIVASTPQITFLEGESSLLDLMTIFTDVDSELQFYAYSMNGKVICQCNGLNVISMTPANPHWYGHDVLRLVASDGEYIVSVDLDVNVRPVNNAPINRSCISGITMAEDTEFTLSLLGLFEDVDGDNIHYTVTVGSDIVAGFDDGSLTLAIRPDENWHGSTSFQLYASDGMSSVCQDISVVVTSVNDVPYQLRAIPSIILPSGNSTIIELSSYFEDAETRRLDMEVISGDNITVSKLDVFGFFEVKTADAWEGSDTIQVSVSDGENIVEATISVSAYSEKIVLQSASSDFNVLQSISWMGVGFVVAVAAFALYSTTGNHTSNARAAQKGRVI